MRARQVVFVVYTRGVGGRGTIIACSGVGRVASQPPASRWLFLQERITQRR